MTLFNILDVSTWDFASDSSFVWKSDITFSNIENGNNITEKEFTIFIGKLINALREIGRSEEEISTVGLSSIIELIIDLLAVGINANNALYLINFGIENSIDFSWPIFKVDQDSVDNNKSFNINDQDTWKFATENTLIFEGKPFNISEKKFTEILFVKIMIMAFYPCLQDMYSRPSLRSLTTAMLLDGLKQDKGIVDILEQTVSKMKDVTNSNVGQPNNYARQQKSDDSTAGVYDLTPPSPAGIVVGIILLSIGLIMLFSSINNYSSSVSQGIFSFLLITLSIIPFAMYGSSRSKYFYKVICANMAQWIGRSSNDLIMQWGAPTRTYKFPTDKTMTVLEYKESIRSYASYSHKGYRTGQSKTTKYVKSFFTKDGFIIDYKYSIS
jgi:hypothetical protein